LNGELVLRPENGLWIGITPRNLPYLNKKEPSEYFHNSGYHVAKHNSTVQLVYVGYLWFHLNPVNISRWPA
jgi:hypothetical protein